MYQQVEYDSSLIESISSYLLDDHSENFFDEHNLVGFPAIAPEWSVDIHPEMSSIFVANSSSCAIDSTSSGLINPYFMDEPIDPLPDLDDFDIYGLLNELIPTTNIPSLESDLSQTFLPSTENDNNSDDVQNSKAPTSDRRKYRGVVKRPREKFTAEMRNPEKKGAKIWLGTYETPEEAAMAYDRTAFKIRGAQALLNFPHLVHSHNENPEKYIIKKRSIASTSTSSSSSSSNSLKDGQRKRRIYKLG